MGYIATGTHLVLRPDLKKVRHESAGKDVPRRMEELEQTIYLVLFFHKVFKEKKKTFVHDV